MRTLHHRRASLGAEWRASACAPSRSRIAAVGLPLITAGALTLAAAPAAAAPAPVAPLATPSTTTQSPAVTAQAFPCAYTSGDYTDIVIDGQSRTYRVVIPPAGADSQTPVVVSLHGATGSASGQQNVSGLDSPSDPPAPSADATGSLGSAQATTNPGVEPNPADLQALSGGGEAVRATAEVSSLGATKGFIAVFPQATGEGRNTAWDLAPGNSDARFVDTILASLHASGCGNPGTTSVNGFSNGAMLVSRLLCEPTPPRFAAAAMVGGALSPLQVCAPPPGMDLLVVHGAADTIVPFDGSITPTLEWLGLDNAAPLVDRTTVAQQWALSKDCPSPGWAEAGPAAVIDFSCYRSTTQSVVYPHTGHAWNGPQTNTSELIWAALRPDKPCVAAPLGAPNPALERALSQAIASDVVFRTEFARMLQERLPCDAPFRQQLENALRNEFVSAPNGITAQRIRFAIADEIRVEPDGETARKLREALRG